MQLFKPQPKTIREQNAYLIECLQEGNLLTDDDFEKLISLARHKRGLEKVIGTINCRCFTTPIIDEACFEKKDLSFRRWPP